MGPSRDDVIHAWQTSQADAVETLTMAALRELVLAHQYVAPSPGDVAALRRIFAAVVGGMGTAVNAGVGAGSIDDNAWARHQQRYAAWHAQQLSADAPAVVCGEYSAELQLEVLGLDANAPHAAGSASPLLDIGCGASGALVRYLRARGWEAWGLDRMAPAELAWRGAAAFSADASWLTARLPEGQFATITSHMAFSLHAIHHHLRGGGPALRHADTYRHLLQALRGGGQLRYAPGLPFLEAHLPTGFIADRRPLPEALGAAIAPLSRAAGAAVDYACCVTRA